MTPAQKKKINAVAGEVKSLWLRGWDWRVAVGLKLIELKSLLPHGYFQKTVKNLGIPYQSCVNYMREARAVKSQTNQIDTFEMPEQGGLEPNPDHGKPVTDPQADKVKQAVLEVIADQQGRPPSRILQTNISCDTVSQKQEIKSGLKELGIVAAPRVHEFLHPNLFWLRLYCPDITPEQSRCSVYDHLLKGDKT